MPAQRKSLNLRTRVLVLVLLGFATVAVPAYAAFSWIVNSTVIQLGTLFAEKQILYDRFRGLEALTREVSLAETLAGTQSIRDWAVDETDPDKRRRAIAELEHYRQSFADKSYFFVIGASGNYYFNDASNAYAGDQYRYTLDEANPRDGWYYNTAALGQGCHLNVDHDDKLLVTKVWMNCVIREGHKVLGILGTGIDLSSFIHEVVNVPQAGVTAMFVDHNGAVQAHRDQNLVDYHSLTREMTDRKTVFAMLDRPSDATVLQAMMDAVSTPDAQVRSQFMQIGGKSVLVGVGYLDRLGWYNVTLMDIDTIIDKRLFLPVGLLLAGMMVVVAVLMMLVFKRQVLDRVAQLETAVELARAGGYTAAAALADDRQDEIGRLSLAFADMAQTVGRHTMELEARVRERTEELERLAFKDTQTGIANRRGFMDIYQSLPRHQVHGLLLIDIDRFKSINDTYGHAAGDAVVHEIARRIQVAAGPDNHCARWGGDEFIVVLVDSAPTILRALAYGMMAQVCAAPVVLPDGRTAVVTVSVGACLAEPGETLEAATDMADAALYIAKDQGRNKVVVFDSDSAAIENAKLGLG